MGLPEIFISFETAAVSAIQRSSRGVLGIIISDVTDTDGREEVYRSFAEVPEEFYAPENYRLLKLAFMASPAKVIVLRTADITEDTLQTVRADWLVAPGMENELFMSIIKMARDMGHTVKGVMANAGKVDCEGIVNLWLHNLVLDDGEIDSAQYAARIAGILASMPLNRSATYVELPEIVSCVSYTNPDELIDDGKMLIVPGADGVYRIGRAINSLVTLTPDKGEPFQKIKIVEGIDLIRADITKAFEKSYIGKVLNDYDNKLLLVTAINAYFRSLEGDVLDKTADNLCYVSLAGQRQYLESRGIDTSEMKDAEILRANTGSEVFLEAKLTFCDAMEDLSLAISM